MIRLTRLNRTAMLLNSELIEHIEMTPDTVITLTTGQRLVVRESPEEIVDRVVAFRQAVLQPCCAVTTHRNMKPDAADASVAVD